MFACVSGIIGITAFLLILNTFRQIDTNSPEAPVIPELADMTKSQADTSPTPTSTPTPKPIPHGKIPFMVSNSSKVGPCIRKGTIDPYDPLPDQVQTMQIFIAPLPETTEATLLMQTDTTEHEYVFERKEIVDGLEMWEASWTTPDDTYLYRYNAVLTAKNDSGQSSVHITLR